MTGGPLSAHTGSMDPDAVVEPHAADPHVHGVAALKPRLRGWLHFGAAPLAFVLGLILMVITPTVGLRAAVAVYVLTTVLLFGVSAAYHLGAGSARVNDFLHKLDHANIYLFIAGSYTPFAAALPSATLRWTILALVWGIALVGLIVRVAWTAAPRWLVTGPYLALGWVAIFFLPAFYRDLGADHRRAAGHRRGPVLDRGRGLRPQEAQPAPGVVRVPRALPRVHDRGLPGAVRRRGDGRHGLRVAVAMVVTA